MLSLNYNYRFYKILAATALMLGLFAFKTSSNFNQPVNSVSSPVNMSSDDAEENLVTGSVSLNSSDLELINDGFDQAVGMRFNDLGIPQCAVITSAYIQFSAKGVVGNSDPCDLIFYGEASDNAQTFSTNNFNISSRPKTNASANWSPPSWFIDEEAGLLQQTTDLSAVIQEIVNREGFSETSSIVIIVEGEGVRRAYSYDQSPSVAPVLFLEYNSQFPDDDGDGVCNAIDQCPNSPEPGMSCDDGDPETPNDYVDENCNCVGGFDCPEIFANFGDPCDDGIPGTYDDQIVLSCTCVGFWECPELMAGFGYPCDDGDPNTIYDSIDSTCNCTGVPFIQIGVNAESDDAEEIVANGAVDLTSSDLELVDDVDIPQVVGVRFGNIGIPHCAVIVAAHIQFVAKNSDNANPSELMIYGEDSDDAQTFINSPFNISNRNRTDTFVTWSPPDWQGDEQGLSQQTADISAIVQEIVNRPGFADNSAMAFIFEGIGMRRAFSYEAGASLAPVLYIEYLDVFNDDDNDGVCNAIDLCPGSPEPGTPCDDGFPQTYNDTISLTCACNGILYDCPVLLANFFDPCDDGDPETPNDYVDENCNCIGGFDCPDIFANFGDPCDDGIPGTYDDQVDSTCTCVGIWECPEFMAGFGDPCDDNDPNTLNDFIDSTCTCTGAYFINISVNAESDDAEEIVANGAVDLTSSDLELVDDVDIPQVIGVRFDSLGIPHCAVIVAAHIQFVAKNSTNNNPCELVIYGEDSDTAQTFVNVPYDISSRNRTDAFVSWSPPDWQNNQQGLAQQTPDISVIVQEIVNRPGFTDTSAIAFILEGFGMRRAYSYEAGDTLAPKLYIEYLDVFYDNDNDGVCNAIDLCPGIPEPGTPCDDGIPETYDDAIDSTCVCSGVLYDCPGLLANFFDSCDDGDPETPNDYVDEDCNCIGGFDCPDIFANFGDPCDDGIAGTYDDQIDVDCNCTGIWECPDLMMAFGDPCDDEDPSTLDDMITLDCECVGSPILFAKIAMGSDDAEESETGQVDVESSDLELVYDGNNQTVGLRFINLNIPQGVLIDTAFIQFTCDEMVNVDPCNLQIFGEASDNALTFEEVNGNISGRSKTNAFVAWSPHEWLEVNDAGVEQRTPNLKSVIQEIVNRGGFTTGSPIAFIFEGTGARIAMAYEKDPERSPELYVRYDLPLSEKKPTPVEKQRLIVYPVPATDHLNIAFTCNSSGNVPIRIYDFNGKLLYKNVRPVYHGKNNILIENLDLQNGIYLVQLYFDQTIHTAKFTVTK